LTAAYAMNKAGLERNENIFRFTNAWFSGQVLARRPEVQVHGPISQEVSPFIDKRGAIRMNVYLAIPLFAMLSVFIEKLLIFLVACRHSVT
jgi:hypothetical protein